MGEREILRGHVTEIDTWWLHDDKQIYDELSKFSKIHRVHEEIDEKKEALSIMCEALRRIMEKLDMVTPTFKKRFDDEEMSKRIEKIRSE